MKTFVRILSLTLVAVMLCATLASCAPASDPAKAEAALKEAEYIVLNDSTITPAVFKLGGYDLTNVVTATKTTEDKDGKTVVELVVIYYFADKDNAEKAFSKVEEDAKEKADVESVRIFGENLRQLLLARPVGQKRVLAIEIGRAHV